ncbi:MAG: amidase [Betaproteobacteria bacterium]|nr:amidase [Betaproteobacteria bacterium]
MSGELHHLSAVELTAAYAARRLSPVEVTQATLARIDAVNPKVNAFCVVDHESALAAARESEARWRKGRPLSFIDGVPAGIKDLVLARGWPTLRGSKTVDPAGPWNDDAPATARLREAGAVLLGKTTTPEWGWKGVTDSPLTGITRNPWDLNVTPGGSSGGASAALAAGMGALHVGTDGGGSIRIPSSFCGLAGIKAHFGRVPAWPLSPMGNVAHVGPMARTVRDCAGMLDILARPDARDWTALPPPAAGWLAGITKNIKGLRIAYSPRLGYIKYVHPEVEATVLRAVETFIGLGAHVEQADPGFADCAPLFATHWFATARNTFGKLPPEKFAQMDPGLQATCEYARKYAIGDFLDYQQQRVAVGEAMKRMHLKYDVLITPALAIPAFEVGKVMPALPSGIDADPADWTWWTPFSYPFNLTQQPAISVNCGYTEDGLPIGLQIVAPAYREDLALRTALAFEATQAPIAWPELAH